MTLKGIRVTIVAGLSVGILAISYSDYFDDQPLVENVVYDPLFPDTDSIVIFRSRQLSDAVGARSIN
jgi:hypothetical protein